MGTNRHICYHAGNFKVLLRWRRTESQHLPYRVFFIKITICRTFGQYHRIRTHQLSGLISSNYREIKYLKKSRFGVAIMCFGKSPVEVIHHLFAVLCCYTDILLNACNFTSHCRCMAVSCSRPVICQRLAFIQPAFNTIYTFGIVEWIVA